MATCPDGHESTSADFCDTCGMRIEGAPPAVAGAGAAGTSGGEVCPQCGTDRNGQFCEACGFDYTTGTPSPVPAQSPAPSLSPPLSGSSSPDPLSGLGSPDPLGGQPDPLGGQPDPLGGQPDPLAAMTGAGSAGQDPYGPATGLEPATSPAKPAAQAGQAAQDPSAPAGQGAAAPAATT